ncbi:hypothetical protein OBBRIDRAFT_424533 [Obba rivulosa]|uniref:Uncharacterized protein n=1 Tax=Obba rivulosa TaxID=1052685 RepID=A0A8E2DDY6_9APHY|nr:hypothetical protein OBBRIDRAFT_424533 [Obba rivulosa]
MNQLAAFCTAREAQHDMRLQRLASAPPAHITSDDQLRVSSSEACSAPIADAYGLNSHASGAQPLGNEHQSLRRLQRHSQYARLMRHGNPQVAFSRTLVSPHIFLRNCRWHLFSTGRLRAGTYGFLRDQRQARATSNRPQGWTTAPMRLGPQAECDVIPLLGSC